MFFTARRQPPATALAALATPVAVIAEPQDLRDRAGCGWFDSSFELSQGLEVSDAPEGVEFELWLLAFDVATAQAH
ncbi:hypothetical protein J7U46_22270 [Pelomonas sp. V22]|uniref:hypothetical protein n=1 Tax=Pelomonas sp. V22 TaxID=2822139 RepID=UPI0024A949B9|nr:hypothetical protein [Pelomonas sp. V22]MDI4635808.1 hypothetical protein [Pelomonas sp. V22]